MARRDLEKLLDLRLLFLPFCFINQLNDKSLHFFVNWKGNGMALKIGKQAATYITEREKRDRY